MRKKEFLQQLENKLNVVRKTESVEIISYYDEIIQDAIDSGENESEFINRLGSIDQIVDTIRKDAGFVQKLKEKRDFTLREAINTTAKIVGYAIFGIVSFAIVVASAALVISGLSTAIYSGILMVVSDEGIYLLLMRLGNVILGIGLVLFACGVFSWYFRFSKKSIEKLLREVQKRLRKEA